MISIFYICALLTVLSLTGLTFIFFRTYRDPRWRVFDFHSRQATEGDIYNVAEVPVISGTKLVGPRRMRFEFLPPIQARSWEIHVRSTGEIIRNPFPEVSFSSEAQTETFRLIPEGHDLLSPIEITIQFYPQENYTKANLSWPDNYHTPVATPRFSRRPPYSVREWAGLRDPDLDVILAKSILEDRINSSAPALERSADVFRVVMEDLKDAGGVPSDEVQDASPMQTYDMLQSGRGKGFCENVALVYYLFANAAGIKTRLVDIAGKFGPLKLTGHYVCESWIPEHGAWCFVDPQSRVAHVKTAKGRLLNTLDIKRLVDLGVLDTCTVHRYNPTTGTMDGRDAVEFNEHMADYLADDLVLAYKFGYARNMTFSRLHDFLFYPTLLYATFAAPRLYLIKQALLIAAGLGGTISLILMFWILMNLAQ